MPFLDASGKDYFGEKALGVNFQYRLITAEE